MRNDHVRDLSGATSIAFSPSAIGCEITRPRFLAIASSKPVSTTEVAVRPTTAQTNSRSAPARHGGSPPKYVRPFCARRPGRNLIAIHMTGRSRSTFSSGQFVGPHGNFVVRTRLRRGDGQEGAGA